MSFLVALYRCMPYQKHSTRAVCRLFNPKDKTSLRETLRDEWAALNEGGASLDNVERVLRSCVGTTLAMRGATYTLALVPRAGIGSRDIWRFVPPLDSIDQFLRMLRARMGVEPIPLSAVREMLEEEELGQIAASLLYREPPLTRQQVASLLSRGCKYRRVDGWVLVRRPDGLWVFVQR